MIIIGTSAGLCVQSISDRPKTAGFLAKSFAVHSAFLLTRTLLRVLSNSSPACFIASSDCVNYNPQSRRLCDNIYCFAKFINFYILSIYCSPGREWYALISKDFDSKCCSMRELLQQVSVRFACQVFTEHSSETIRSSNCLPNQCWILIFDVCTAF